MFLLFFLGALVALCLLLAGAFVAALVANDREARRADLGVETIVGQ